MAVMAAKFLFLISLLVITNAQNQQGTTVTPVRYALILKKLAEVTNGRVALQAKVAQYRDAYNQLQKKSASAKGMICCCCC